MNIPVQAQILKKIYESSFDDLRKKHGLTMNEIIFLLYLKENEMQNTASQIVEQMMYTKSHISKSVDSLYRNNLIDRVPDTYDRKVIHLIINPNAIDIVDELKQRDTYVKKVITKGISERELDIFESVLERMQDNINEEFNKIF